MPPVLFLGNTPYAAKVIKCNSTLVKPTSHIMISDRQTASDIETPESAFPLIPSHFVIDKQH